MFCKTAKKPPTGTNQEGPPPTRRQTARRKPNAQGETRGARAGDEEEKTKPRKGGGHEQKPPTGTERARGRTASDLQAMAKDLDPRNER